LMREIQNPLSKSPSKHTGAVPPLLECTHHGPPPSLQMKKKKPVLMKNKIFSSVLLPIFKDAAAAGDLYEVLPNACNVLQFP
jgi:hypothetical protein